MVQKRQNNSNKYYLKSGTANQSVLRYLLGWLGLFLRNKKEVRIFTAKNSFNSKPMAEHSQVPQAFLGHSPLLPRISRINSNKNENSILKVLKSVFTFCRKLGQFV